MVKCECVEMEQEFAWVLEKLRSNNKGRSG